MTDHLLPPNASQAQIDRARTLARISDVPVPISDLWNAHTCPLSLLPWLAWTLSVDQWSVDWPESRQRNVVAAAWDFHATKGTRHAVERALALIDIEATITEWWEHLPALPQGTFQVAVQVPREASPMLAADIDDARALIARAKRASQHLSFWLQGEAKVELHVAAGLTAAHRAIRAGSIGPEPIGGQMAMTATVTAVHRIVADVTIEEEAA